MEFISVDDIFEIQKPADFKLKKKDLKSNEPKIPLDPIFEDPK